VRHAERITPLFDQAQKSALNDWSYPAGRFKKIVSGMNRLITGGRGNIPTEADLGFFFLLFWATSGLLARRFGTIVEHGDQANVLERPIADGRKKSVCCLTGEAVMKPLRGRIAEKPLGCRPVPTM